METIKTYKACDGTTWNNRFACARWEFHVQAGLLAKLMLAFKGTHRSQQANWCGGDPEEKSGGFACACMGCANHAFHDLGLQYEHWKVWFEEFRGEQVGDEIPDPYTDVNVVLTDVGTKRIDVFKVIRAFTGLGIVETKKLMETPNAALRSDIDYYTGNKFVVALEEAGATAKLEVASKQRRTIIKSYGFE